MGLAKPTLIFPTTAQRDWCGEWKGTEPPNLRFCRTCAFWHQKEQPQYPGAGSCRRYAPRMVIVMGPSGSDLDWSRTESEEKLDEERGE
jgi:hypothetical protein